MTGAIIKTLPHQSLNYEFPRRQQIAAFSQIDPSSTVSTDFLFEVLTDALSLSDVFSVYIQR